MIGGVHTRRMVTRATSLTVALGVLMLVLNSCGGGDPEAAPEPIPTQPSSTAPTVKPSDEAPATDDDGLALKCRGNGYPTIVFEAGLDTGGETFSALADHLRPLRRVCRLGQGQDRGEPARWPEHPIQIPGRATSARARSPRNSIWRVQEGPVRRRGLVRRRNRRAGVRHPAPGPDCRRWFSRTSSSAPAVRGCRSGGDIAWVDGGRQVDTERAVRRAVDRSTSTSLTSVVLDPRSSCPVRLAELWDGYHDRLTASSKYAPVHVRAVGGSHELHASAPELLLQAIEEVAGSVVEPDLTSTALRPLHRITGSLPLTCSSVFPQQQCVDL